MNIKRKLAIQFALIVASILLMFSLAVYFSSAQYRKNEFSSRLKDKALNIAKLLIDVDEVDNTLLKVINRNTISLPEEKVIIYNYLNEEIYNSKEENGDSIPVALLNQIRLDNEIYYREAKKEVIGLLYPGKYKRYIVVASATDTFGLSKLRNLQYVLVFVFFISVAITIAAGWLFASQALKPISKIVTDVNNISASNLHARLGEGNRRDEIANLAIIFNKMLERLETAFHIQKNFVANASHELRTPLTSVTSQIQVALLKERKGEEYEKVLQSILEDVNGLSKLSNDLLELAQMDLENKKITVNPLRLDELLIESIEALTEIKHHYQISFEYDLLAEDEEKLTIVGSETLLKSALINLIDNACKFSNGLPATVRLGEEPGYLKIKIIDKGIGISKEELSHVREPFYRADNSSNIKGHGLGLSLTDKIIKLHKGKLDIESRIDDGTTITVLFPMA
ncbi:HAMP domain-containing protein [Rhodocytophaga rosea]|uniref:histidine kinase n=1 Tax=Rhodocytophaga rosea TaxID=2704465 RepID=A0A6C0GL71_9BACT|nr:ATP-binding protein [Rhodocytophaga rosea]QHT68758.1 HAMP domain-containing protein [Rhodocytophaga rosea]